MKDERCDTCRWWHHVSVHQSSREECRRHAPITVPREAHSSDTSFQPVWPTTTWQDFCGDWQADQKAIARNVEREREAEWERIKAERERQRQAPPFERLQSWTDQTGGPLICDDGFGPVGNHAKDIAESKDEG